MLWDITHHHSTIYHLALPPVYVNSLQPLDILPHSLSSLVNLILHSWSLLPVRQSAPATPSMHIQPLYDPPSKPVPHVSKCKICKEFSGNNIKQLLHAVISVNPNHETLKNKVKSLLTWVQVHLTFCFIRLFYCRLANNMWAAPPRNWHNLQWPVKQRRTQHFRLNLRQTGCD